MILKSLSYSQFEGEPTEWRIEGLTLGLTNLLVAKNATGKSRVLTIIHILARMVAGEMKPALRSGNWNVTFDNDGANITYSLSFENGKVAREEYSVDGKQLLVRGINGEGKIFAEKIGSSAESVGVIL